MNWHKLIHHCFLIGFLFSLSSAAAQEDPTNEFWTAVRNGDVATVKTMLDAGMDPNTRFNSGITPLIAASVRGQLEVVKLLLERGADPGLREDIYGLTPAGMSLLWGKADMLPILTEHGIEDAGLFLRIGAARGNLKVLDIALAAYAPEPAELTSAWILAKNREHPEILQKLESLGAQPPSPLDTSEYNKYTGTYRSESGEELVVEIVEGKLVASVFDVIFEFFQREVIAINKSLLILSKNPNTTFTFRWRGDLIAGVDIAWLGKKLSLNKVAGEEE